MPHGARRASLALGEEGLRQAQQRVREYILTDVNPLTALGEMLAWATAIEAWYGADESRSDRQRAYWKARNNHRNGVVAAGFRYARNRVMHQLGLVAEIPLVVDTSDRVPATWGNPAEEWVWAPADQLAQLAGSSTDDLLDFYRDHLAGEYVMLTLQPVVQWLTMDVKGFNLPPP